jgi:hypothetical protein
MLKMLCSTNSLVALETIPLHGLSWENQAAKTIAGAFPALFPHGVGDGTNHDRPKSVTLADIVSKHLLWYVIQREDGS